MALYLICESVDFWKTEVIGSKGDRYIVSFARGEWTCTCDGYKFRKSCRHITQSKANYCGWKQLIEPSSDKFISCPSCGREIQIREW